MKKKSEINIKYTGNKVLINLQTPVITRPTPTLMTPTNFNKSKGLLVGLNDKKKINLPKTTTNKDHPNFSNVWSESKIATLQSSE